MPMKKGSDRATVSHNIKEMIKAGHKPSQAVAASLANSRKYAKGGEVDDEQEDSDLKDLQLGSVDSRGDMGEAGEPIYPEQSDDEGLAIGATEDASRLAEGLMAKHYGANDNSNDYNPDDTVSGQKMAKGGQVQPEEGMALGNKPDLDWIDDGNGEPMSVQAGSDGSGGPLEHRPMRDVAGDIKPSGLSKEAQLAIDKRKKSRKYGQYDPR